MDMILKRTGTEKAVCHISSELEEFHNFLDRWPWAFGSRTIPLTTDMVPELVTYAAPLSHHVQGTGQGSDGTCKRRVLWSHIKPLGHARYRCGCLALCVPPPLQTKMKVCKSPTTSVRE